MRDAVSGIEVQARAEAKVASGESGDRVHAFALYSAFALIAASVFGTLSYHPF